MRGQLEHIGQTAFRRPVGVLHLFAADQDALGQLRPVQRLVVRRQQQQRVGIDRAAPLDGQSDPVRRLPIGGTVDGDRRVGHDRLIGPLVHERQSGHRPAAGVFQVLGVARQFVGSHVRPNQMRRGQNVGRVQGNLPSLRAARGPEPLDVLQGFQARGQRFLVAGEIGVFQQDVGWSRADAAGRVFEMTAAVFAVVAVRAVGQLAAPQRFGLSVHDPQPLLGAAADEKAGRVADVGAAELQPVDRGHLARDAVDRRGAIGQRCAAVGHPSGSRHDSMEPAAVLGIEDQAVVGGQRELHLVLERARRLGQRRQAATVPDGPEDCLFQTPSVRPALGHADHGPDRLAFERHAVPGRVVHKVGCGERGLQSGVFP